MSALDDKIDHLYRLPLDEFTGARNALAKSLTGADAKRVRALAKPTVVPWAVNQVYWRARATWDRLLASGERLRTAQIAALEGRAADVRAADQAHRRAIADAVAEAGRLAAAAGSQPGTDALTRTFEALSLAPAPPEPPGHLTHPPQPGGFEALAGVRVRETGSGRTHASAPQSKAHGPAAGSDPADAGAAPPVGPAAKRQRKADRAREHAAASAARRHAAALKKAEAAVARAEAAEQQARAVWERAHDALLNARQTLSNLKSAI